MTTTIDPYGTPSTVFSRSGASIQHYDVKGGDVFYLQTPSSVSHVVVNMLNVSPYPVSGEGIVLPSSAEIGDMIYFYVEGSYFLNVIAPSGDTIIGYPEIQLPQFRGAMLMKHAPNKWSLIGLPG